MIRLFHAYIPVSTFLFVVFEIALMFGIFVGATYLLVDVDPADYLLNNLGGISLILVVLTFIMGLYFQNLYSELHVKSRVKLLQQLCMVTGVAMVAQGVISYLSVELRVPVRVMLTASLAVLVAVFLIRILFSVYAEQAVAKAPLLLVGSDPILLEIQRYIEERPQTGLEIAGYVNDRHSAEEFPQRKVFGGLEALRGIVQAVHPARIVVGLKEDPDPALIGEMLGIRYAGYSIETAANTYESVCGRVSIHEMQPAKVICAGSLEPDSQEAFYKQLFNGVAAFGVALVTLPLMLLTLLVLRLTVRGPLWERERVTGLNGTVFHRHRFRASGQTAAERVARRLGLDKLPQLINVLRGEMALVGPAPEKPEYVEALSRHIPFYREKYRAKPGMTGWAQIHWIDESGMEDAITRLEYDLYYVKNASLNLDTLIVLHTLKDILVSS